MQSLLVSLKQAAELLGISERTVQRLVEQGSLESVKIRKRRLVKVAAVMALAQHSTGRTVRHE